MKDEEIIELLPKEYKNKIDELGIQFEFIIAIQDNIGLFSNGESNFRNSVVKPYKNFADFMVSMFLWKCSPKGFKWWFKTVFGYEFEHPTDEESDPNYGRYTNSVISNAIESYKSEDGFSYYYEGEVEEEREDYSDKEAFYDAYGDGFSDYEDDRFFNSDDD